MHQVVEDTIECAVKSSKQREQHHLCMRYSTLTTRNKVNMHNARKYAPLKEVKRAPLFCLQDRNASEVHATQEDVENFSHSLLETPKFAVFLIICFALGNPIPMIILEKKVSCYFLWNRLNSLSCLSVPYLLPKNSRPTKLSNRTSQVLRWRPQSILRF